ncbi:RmlC-like cupin [Cryphonectria parasitica EP155]|uniref:RmlC-like cupin n=1 Tax=Cryphonectria parasitica (strain ATCC 38755 / EP155) TaxID=660469 RepID=A0A9P4Y2R7_CRYP1|nr:RmlC-like cupin [Cryphonectria parasitica EP155]KAF3765404.1 RmlC-like cupin [Cryphonectria parasitica EP155]
MSVPVLSTPPDKRSAYIIDQLEGERITIPGSKGVFRILASSKQTQGGIAVFSSGAVLSDAPGFHWHAEAHDVFLPTKGFLKLWSGDKCRIMGPGDFAYVPPKIIHNPEMLGPHTEQLGLVAPGDWVDFFRYVADSYSGLLVPESDTRDLKAHIIPKVMAARDRFDVHFVRDHQPAEVSDWLASETALPEEALTPYFLRANTGPRQILGGVMSRPFIYARHTAGRFAITSLESSSAYGRSWLAERWITFQSVDHCFCVQEGILKVRLRGEEAWSEVREGQTLLVPAGQAFVLDFGSRYVRAITFTNGKGLEEVVRLAGVDCAGVVLPDEAAAFDAARLQEYDQRSEKDNVLEALHE